MLVMREELLDLSLAGKQNLSLQDLIIDYRRITVAALIVRGSGLLSRSEVLAYDQVSPVDDHLEIKKGVAQSTKKAFADKSRYGDLLKKPVYTKSQKYLGQVATYKLDIDSGDIQTIWTRTPIHLRALWKNILLIKRTALIEVRSDKIVVEDAIVGHLSRSSAKQTLGKIYNFGQTEPDVTGSASTLNLLDRKNDE